MNLRSGIIYETVIIFLSICLGVLTNRFLGAEQRGVLAAVMLYPTILSSASSLQWDRQIISDLKSKIVSLHTVKNKIITTALVNGTLGATMAVLLSLADNKISMNQTILIGIYSIVSIPCSLVQLYTNACLIVEDKTLQVYYNRTILPASMLAILITFTLLKNIDYADIVLITMASWLLATIYVYNFYKINIINIKENIRNVVKQLKQYQRNVAHLFDSCANHIDIFVVLTFMPLSFAGAYTFFKLLDLPYRILLSAFGTATPSRLVTHGHVNVPYFLSFLSLTLAITLLAIFFPLKYYDIVIDLVVGPSFTHFSYLIKPLIVSFWTGAIGVHLYTLLTHSGAVSKLFFTQRFDLLLRTILIGTFTFAYEWVGLVLSIVICNMVKIIFILYQFWKINNNKQ